MNLFSAEYEAEGSIASGLEPVFLGADAERERIEINLGQITTIAHPTDIQFLPDSRVMLVLEKEGKLHWYDLRRSQGGIVAEMDVLIRSEQGLLGLIPHPNFAGNGKVYLNYSVKSAGREVSRVAEWRLSQKANGSGYSLDDERVLMDVEQPYPNHNAGQLAFGPDGMLYIGWGDGGFRDDPHGHGQNPATLLGSMLRIDVTPDPDTGKPYTIPADNPFLGRDNAAPEAFALGFRNPWKYSFAPDGRLVVADVGQDTWEEVSIVEAGKNYGWKVREAGHCFAPEKNCQTAGLTDPVHEYDHEEGKSITGGFVYTGRRIPELRGKYVFGDFVSGRIWAADLPENDRGRAKVYALGKWPLLISTFGQDPSGEIYVGDYARGGIYRLEP